MITKYEKLTESIQDKRDELDQMNKDEVARVENMILEEKGLELDVDRVVDYLVNLVAYLNDKDNFENENQKKSIRKGMLESKDHFAKRFKRAGLDNEGVSMRHFSNLELETKSNKRKNYKKYSEDFSENQANTPSVIGKTLANANQRNNTKSVNINIDPTSSKQQNHASSIRPQSRQEFDEPKLRIEDLDDETAETIFKLVDDVEDLKNKLSTSENFIQEAVAEMKSEFDKEKEVLTAKFDSTKIFLQHYVENVQKDLEEELIKRNREKANVNLKINSLETRADKFQRNFKNNDDSFEYVSEVVNYLVQTAQINHAMETQDEIDREKLALMGYKEENESAAQTLSKTMNKSTSKSNIGDGTNPYVTLDKQCLTCSGQSSVVLKAFKIACLTYKPNLVTLSERMMKSYSRLDLINLKGNMLKYIEKIPLTKSQREGTDPEKERTKIFNQYINLSASNSLKKDTMTNSLFNSRHPKVTIRSDMMSGSDYNRLVSPQEIRKKNITMLSDKTEALARNPFNDTISKMKKRMKEDTSKQDFGPTVMALPKIKRGNQTTR